MGQFWIYLAYFSLLGMIGSFTYTRIMKQRETFYSNRDKERKPKRFLGETLQRLSIFYSPTQIRTLIRQSGVPFELTPEGMLVIQIAFVAFLVLIVWLLAIPIGLKVFLTMLFLPGGYMLPILFLSFLRSDRRNNFAIDFRDFKRMMILNLEAGLDIQGAASMALRNAQGVFRDIVEPVYYRIGFTDTMISVFYAVYEDIGLDEVRMFASLILQAERNGMPIVTALQNSLEREWKDKENNMERIYQVRQNIATLMMIFFQFGPIVLSLMVVLGGFVFSQMHSF